MKVAIAGLIDSIPASEHSHYRGWIETLASCLREYPGPYYDEVKVLTGPNAWCHFDQFDQVFFHSGLYYYGEDYSLNLFGGMTAEKADKMAVQLRAVVSVLKDNLAGAFMEFQPPDGLTGALQSRLRGAKFSETHPLYQVCNELGPHLNPLRAIWWKPDVSCSIGFAIGDSHVAASRLPGHVPIRCDRQTLHGALKLGLRSMLDTRLGPNWINYLRSGIFHFGNIDVRHHLCRFGAPGNTQVIRDLVEAYADQVESLGLEEVTLVAPYPIENESRKIAKSVWYKDRPFWGTWKERDLTSKHFADFLEIEAARRCNWKVHRWPAEFLNDKGELKFDVMERPKSIHLSPSFYRWNPFTDQLNDYSALKPKTAALGAFFE